VEELLVDLSGVEKESSETVKKEVTGRKKFRFSKHSALPVIGSIIVILLAITVLVVLFYPSKAISFSERDWILITDFENNTENQVFNKSLNTALSVSIAQSSYINVLPRTRVNETLRRMKKGDVDFIDQSLGQEVALREDVKLMVVPSISQIGDEYVLAAMIQRADDGETLLSEMVQSQNINHLLNSLDDLSRKIRGDLGESLDAISRQSKPLAKVTTSSLEALKQYSLGIENHWNANFTEARTYYENALKIDSNFTSARASLGMLIYEKFPYEMEKGRQLLSQAVKHVDNLTDKEKFGILAFYANAVEHDNEKAVKNMKMLLALYPDYYPAHNNLGWYYSQMGRYEESVSEYKKAISLNPYLVFTYCGLNFVYLNHLAELDSAFIWIHRQIEYNEDNPWGYDYLGWYYLGLDSLDQARQAFEKASKLEPNFTMDLYRLAHTYRLLGRYQDAISVLNKIIRIDSSDASAYYDKGVNLHFQGDDRSARLNFEKYKQFADSWIKENPRNGSNYILLGTVLTRLNQLERGMAMGQKGLSIDSTLHFEFAQLLAVQDRKQEAMNQLTIAVKSGYHNYIWIRIHPDFHNLYKDPAFKKLIKDGLHL
jgi:tetratricopeptide (TPR) repeat protein